MRTRAHPAENTASSSFPRKKRRRSVSRGRRRERERVWETHKCTGRGGVGGACSSARSFFSRGAPASVVARPKRTEGIRCPTAVSACVCLYSFFFFFTVVGHRGYLPVRHTGCGSIFCIGSGVMLIFLASMSFGVSPYEKCPSDLWQWFTR